MIPETSRREYVRPVTVRINGKRTSIRLEPAVMQALDEISSRQGRSRDEILTEIEPTSKSASRTAAVRAFVMNHLRVANVVQGPMTLAETLVERLLPYKEAWHGSEAEDFAESTTSFSTEGVTVCGSAYLGEVFAKWTELSQRRNRLPEPGDIDELFPPALARDQFNVMDVRADDPSNFRLVKHSQLSSGHIGVTLTGQRLGAYPIAPQRFALERDFWLARDGSKPALQICQQRFGQLHRDYIRLLLPVAEAGARLTDIISVIRPLRGPCVNDREAAARLTGRPGLG